MARSRSKSKPRVARVKVEEVNLANEVESRTTFEGDGEGEWKRLFRGQASKPAGALFARLQSTFLPEGYPDSVAPEYTTYQCWDTVQALCSYLRGILATAALMEGIGVGSESATPLAAAITWVLRDGAGMLGGLIFASWRGTGFDKDVKIWRLFADGINDVGLTLDLLAPLFGPEYFIYVVSLACVFKSMCGVAAGATKASLTAHFALDGNMADVQCKEGSQETAVTLIGLVFGAYFAKLANGSNECIWVAFFLLTALHFYANYEGVRCLRLPTLNMTRASILVARFYDEESMAIDAIAAAEPVLFVPSSKIRLGQRWVVAKSGPQELAAIRDAKTKFFVLRESADANAVVDIAMKEGSTSLDELEAFFTASTALRLVASDEAFFRERPADDEEVDAVFQEAAEESAERFPAFCDELKAEGWNTSRLLLGTGTWRYKSTSL
jgi:hypothetical protein